MADNTYTRCPGCATVFRVTPAQLALREGQVRCGHCRAVFDANEHVVALDAPAVDEMDVHDELAAGRPTVTLRSADALQPVEPAPARTPVDAVPAAAEPAPAPVDAATAPIEPASAPVETPAAPMEDAEARTERAPPETSIDATSSADSANKTSAPVDNEPNAASAPIDIAALDRIGRFEWKPRKPLRDRPKALYAAAIALLLATLALQAVAEYRDSLAAHAPPLRPLLQRICDLAGCSVEALRDAAALSIDASDLQADPAHRGVLQLTATIRNRAAYAIAYPYLELTLTDASDRIVARRAFPPAEYSGGASTIAAGIPGNGEKLVTLMLDASATSQAGYRLYLFYP